MAVEPKQQCKDGKHYYDTDKKGHIIGDVCRCGKHRIKRMT